MMLIFLTTLVALYLAQCIHYGSANPAVVAGRGDDDDSEMEHVVATSSELTLLFQKCDLNFSSTVINSDAGGDDGMEEWISNDEAFMHFILPKHGDPCGSEGLVVLTVVEEDEEQDSGDDSSAAEESDYDDKTRGRRQKGQQQRRLSSKSDKKDSKKTGKKSSSMTTTTTIATSCPVCCGGTRNNPDVTPPGACVRSANEFFSTLQKSPLQLVCSWVSSANTGDCLQLSFNFLSTAGSCTGVIPFTPNQCPPLTRRKLRDDDDKTIPMKRHKTAISFVRVPKTGSTTMLQLLYQLPYMFGWDDHLSDDDEYDGDNQEEERIFAESATLGGNNNKQTTRLSAISCVFAYAPTTAHLGSNFHDDRSMTMRSSAHEEEGGDDDHDISAVARRRRRLAAERNDCPHIPYPGLLNEWTNSLERWSPPKTAVLEHGNDAKSSDRVSAMTTTTSTSAQKHSFSFGFQAFSVVRDPFDRLVSYFFYIQRHEFLKNTVTDEQYDRVLAGDLYGWMELLHEQGGCGLQLPFQYHYFHHDLETAIDLIEQQEDENGQARQPPKVFTLVTECYKPSLYLMAEALEGLEMDMVEEFVNSPLYKSNKNKHSVTNKHSYGEGKANGDLKSLRELAEVWFEEDFIFYNAAVRQFKKYMAQSAVDPIHFQDCPYWEEEKENNSNNNGAVMSE